MTDPQIDALFRWFTSVELPGRTIWLRTLGAADDAERTRRALLASRALRARLFTEGSPERSELLSGLKGLGRKDLLAVIRVYQTEMAKTMSLSEVHPKKDPPVPVEKTLDAVMDAADEWDKEVMELANRREAWVNDQIRVYMGKVGELPDDELLERALDTEITSLCANAYAQEFSWQTILMSCFDDEAMTQRTFASIDDVRDIGGRVYERLITEYGRLDVFSMKAEDLKN